MTRDETWLTDAKGNAAKDDRSVQTFIFMKYINMCIRTINSYKHYKSMVREAHRISIHGRKEK